MSPHVAILGGGVIGASAAYFLTLRGTRCTLIESTGIAHGASGKAGGFLAKSWQAGSATGALAEKSFELHSELAETLGGDKYGYRRVDTYSCDLGKKKKGLSPAKSVKGGPLNWFKTDKVANSRSMGTKSDTAQVHPHFFTHALLRAAHSTGLLTVLLSPVEGLEFDATNKLTGVKVGRFVGDADAAAKCAEQGYTAETASDPKQIEVDYALVAMGPWSKFAKSWLPKGAHIPNIDGHRAHSIVVKPAVSLPSECIFADTPISDPEFYPRPDGTLYICGASPKHLSMPLPEDPKMVQVDPAACEELEALATEVLEAKISFEKRQACYLPISETDTVVLGFVPGCEGLAIASGHSVWGINNAPATGLAISELLVDGKVSSFDVSKLMDRNGRIRR